MQRSRRAGKAEWLAQLIESQRRAETAEMAMSRLRETAAKAQEAAKRRGVKPPPMPKIEPLPDLRRAHKVLPTPDAILREEQERLALLSRETSGGTPE